MGAEPRTAAGKELLGNMIGMRRRVPVQMGLDSSREFTEDILRVEAEAVAAYKAELAEKVRALPKDRGDETWSTVSRDLVLALIDDPAPSEGGEGPDNLIVTTVKAWDPS